jgi:hypothetical protein
MRVAIQALFAMPLFNWDSPTTKDVLKQRFWIYWVVTIPLTITTILIWISWRHREKIIRGKEDAKTVDSVA